MLNAGCFCDHVVLPAAGAIPIDADVPFEEAALVGCAVVTGVGAALWTAAGRARATRSRCSARAGWG